MSLAAPAAAAFGAGLIAAILVIAAPAGLRGRHGRGLGRCAAPLPACAAALPAALLRGLRNLDLRSAHLLRHLLRLRSRHALLRGTPGAAALIAAPFA